MCNVCIFMYVCGFESVLYFLYVYECAYLCIILVFEVVIYPSKLCVKGDFEVSMSNKEDFSVIWVSIGNKPCIIVYYLYSHINLTKDTVRAPVFDTEINAIKNFQIYLL